VPAQGVPRQKEKTMTPRDILFAIFESAFKSAFMMEWLIPIFIGWLLLMFFIIGIVMCVLLIGFIIDEGTCLLKKYIR